MRILLLVILILNTGNLFGQYGYVKLDNDSIVVGYWRLYTSDKDGHRGIEVWKTKRDKHPLRIPKSRILEYASKKDTFRIFRNFYPFEDEKYYVENIEGKLLCDGKVKLYSVTFIDYGLTVGVIVSPDAVRVGYNRVYKTYLVKDSENNLVGIKLGREEFIKSIEIVIGDNQELLRRVKNREFKYRDIEKIIDMYNRDGQN